MKANVCGNSTFQINRTKKRLQENDALNAMSEHVSCGERHERPFSLCLAGNRKYTKLNFSSEVRKQFQVSMVQFKQLSCCLRNDKLRTAMMFENSAKMHDFAHVQCKFFTHDLPFLFLSRSRLGKEPATFTLTSKDNC